MKAYLIRGARRDEALARKLPGETVWPNPQLGDYGNIVLSYLKSFKSVLKGKNNSH